MASAQFFILALGTLPPAVQVWDFALHDDSGVFGPEVEGMVLLHLAQAARHLVVGRQPQATLRESLPCAVFRSLDPHGSC